VKRRKANPLFHVERSRERVLRITTRRFGSSPSLDVSVPEIAETASCTIFRSNAVMDSNDSGRPVRFTRRAAD
jgi:hypothetical protein